nr:hypothetical protein CFP56_69381 [Quercus suber]
MVMKIPASLKLAKFLIPSLPTVILANPRRTYHMPQPMNKSKDISLAAAYCICWTVVVDGTIIMRNAIRYFETRSGRRVQLPDESDLPRSAAGGIPTDADLERFKRAPKVLENVAQWAMDVLPLGNPRACLRKTLGLPLAQKSKV